MQIQIHVIVYASLHNFSHTKIDGQKAIIYSRKGIEAYFKENERKGFEVVAI